LLTERPGRRLHNRPAIVVLGLAARLGWPRAAAIWPTADRPVIAVDLSSSHPAEWIRATFEHGARAPHETFARRTLRRTVRSVNAATWSVLRARGLNIGKPDTAVLAVVEKALGRSLDRPSVNLFSPSGAHGTKANLFIFEVDSREPAALVVTMPLLEDGYRLRDELDAVEAAREQLAAKPDLVAALPRAPLWTGTLRGRFAAVLPIDPAARGTGVEDRGRALQWLRRFQEHTAEPAIAWGGEHYAREQRVVEEAWAALRPRSLSTARAIAAGLLGRLKGTSLRQCAIHGDYWRGNVAHTEDTMRVFDWEWSRSRGHPLFDVWTYELAELRGVADQDGGDLEPPLRLALTRVSGEAQARGLDPAMASAMLMPVLAELAIRNRRISGLPSPPEIPYARVMATSERLLVLDSR